MVINSVSIKRTGSDKKFLGFANMTVCGGVVLNKMKLTRDNATGRCELIMPSVEVRDKSRRYLYHPVSREVRAQLLDAAVRTYEAAVQADKLIFTMPLSDEEQSPDFSDFRVRRYEGYRSLKGSVSCVLDGAIALHRIAIVPDEKTGAYRLGLPEFRWPRGGSSQYYRLPQANYDRVYSIAMDEFVATPPLVVMAR